MKRLLALTAAVILTVAHADEKHTDHSAVGAIKTRDAHALLWLPDGRILFGHHDGVQVSTDSGATWKDLVRRTNFDAMNLGIAGKNLFLAGHDIFAKSTDGRTWTDINPTGMNGLDLHGYAIDPDNARRHYALEARTGLYVSDDGGTSWKAARGAPHDVYALAAGAGSVYAVTGSAGLVESHDGLKSFRPVTAPKDVFAVTVAADGALWVGGKQGVWRRSGKAWSRVASGPAYVLAVNPKRPREAIWIDDRGAVHRTGR